MSLRTKSRLLMAVAALVMIPAFVLPLWSIGLVAPQYRDGLGMNIYINDIRGHDTHDIQNINILNHYIGMQEIHPEQVNTLEIMPVVLGALIVTGLVVAVAGNPWLMTGWLAAFMVAGIAGLVDFYMWNIDYGHNLSPDAPIRIPDMTYSPPLVGTKQLLNITASSYPHVGSFVLGLAALLAGFATWLGFRERREEVSGLEADDSGSRGGKRPVRWPVSLLITGSVGFSVLLGLGGCQEAEAPGDGPRPDITPAATEDRMVYGQDQDPFCRGPVERVRYGGEVRTADGEVLRFRSVECMAAHLNQTSARAHDPAQVRVVDFPHGWRLIDVREATFLHTPNQPGPDALNLMAIGSERMVQNLHDAYTGSLLTWDEVLELVESHPSPFRDGTL